MRFLSKEITLFKQALSGISQRNIQWQGVYEALVKERYISKSPIMESAQLCLRIESTCGKYQAEKHVNRNEYTAFSPGMRYGKVSFLTHRQNAMVWISDKQSEKSAINDVIKQAWITVTFFVSVLLVLGIGVSYILSKIF